VGRAVKSIHGNQKVRLGADAQGRVRTLRERLAVETDPKALAVILTQLAARSRPFASVRAGWDAGGADRLRNRLSAAVTWRSDRERCSRFRVESRRAMQVRERHDRDACGRPCGRFPRRGGRATGIGFRFSIDGADSWGRSRRVTN
jgi:hypothetical protein